MDEEDFEELILPAGCKEGDLILQDGEYFVVGLVLDIEVEDGFVAVICEKVTVGEWRGRRIDEVLIRSNR